MNLIMRSTSLSIFPERHSSFEQLARQCKRLGVWMCQKVVFGNMDRVQAGGMCFAGQVTGSARGSGACLGPDLENTGQCNLAMALATEVPVGNMDRQ